MEKSCISGQITSWAPQILALLACFSIITASADSYAQAIRLTPEQQRMLDSLPSAQRERALQELQRLNRQPGVTAGQSPSSNGDQSTANIPPVFPTTETDNVEAEPRGESGSRLVIAITPKEDLTRQELEEIDLDPALVAVQGSQYYELDLEGALELPGLARVSLFDLTAEEMEHRLGAEPSLRPFDISVRLLATSTTGIQALEPFGYDVFESDMFGFEPETAGPVPPDYVLGPGDLIRVQLFGNENDIYDFEVTRDGELILPNLGPVTVAGLLFSELRADIRERVAETMIGTQVSVTMARLRTIRVFVLGDANRPGSYVVSSMATITSALYRSGGISEIGSLRDIQLKRQGRLVARLDLYDLLLRGDTSGDNRLQPGDVIFIPPKGATVGVGGSVRRPAIYELLGNTTISMALRDAGGMLPDAYPPGARLDRISENRERVTIAVDAGSPEGAAMQMKGGDTVFIPEVLRELNDSVVLAGHVHRPGPYQWRAGMRLSSLLPSPGSLSPGADPNYVLIRREDSHRQVSVLSANLIDVWLAPRSDSNLLLQERDTVHVFSLAFGRQRTIEPIMDELVLQSRFGEPSQQVTISGHIRAPGVYPLEEGMRISDLIRAGGFLSEEAYTLEAELARFDVVDQSQRAVDVLEINLDGVIGGIESADITLNPHDHLTISMLPDWNLARSVTLQGEFRFPGVYQIRRGETLGQLLERAGGLTDAAFPEGAVFLRESLREREQAQIDELARRMEADLTALSLETLDTTGAEALTTGQALLSQLRESTAVGRMVIDLEVIRQGGANSTIELRDGDRLMIPQRSQEITVIGETQQNASHMYQPGLARDDYIEMSGGLTRRADRKLIYVVRASGAVESGSRSRWFGRGDNVEIRPGDTIVVPLETDRIRPLTFWTNVTQILYQGAIAVAAIRSFDSN